MIIQFCGMSGAGKTTLANELKNRLNQIQVNCEVLDGDEYRTAFCSDLGFSKEDRNTNIRRLAFVASKLSKFNIVAIICAINPYETVLSEVKSQYNNVFTVYIKCGINTLIQRDTKGLYFKALLPDNHPNKLYNFTGISDPFEIPILPDLIIDTEIENLDTSNYKLFDFVTRKMDTLL
jgi:adenylylsulfate kinase